MSDSVGKLLPYLGNLNNAANCALDRVFAHALNTVRRIPRTGSARPPPTDRLKLYGLYKQSMEGAVQGVMARPIGSSEQVKAEQEKWYCPF